jgi:WD40 repeat protein
VAAPSSGFERILVGDVNGTIRVWKVPPRDARVTLRAPDAIYGTTVSSDGKFVVTDGTDRIVRLIDIVSGVVTELRGHENIIIRVRFSPDSRSFLSGSRDGTVRTWSPTGTAPIRVFSEHASAVGDAEYIEGGRHVVSVGDDGRLLRWSPLGGKASVLFEHVLPLNTLEVVHHNDHVVVNDSEGAVWDVSPGRVASQIRAPDGDLVTILRTSPDGRFLAIGTEKGSVTVYETGGYRVVRRTAMATGVRQINFDPLNRDLLIASEGKQVRVVSLDSRRSLPWYDLAVAARDVAYDQGGETIALVCRDGGTWFYSVSAGAWVYIRDHSTDVLSGRFLRDGALFVSTDAHGWVVTRDVARTFSRRNQ